MTLPNFLGIGVPKAATTWLYELLRRHPQVHMPSQVKEVHYFDRYYERGLDWYTQFFPEVTPTRIAIGEITPNYIYCTVCPQRIAELGSVQRLLVTFRDPLERAYSHYLFRMRIDAYRGSFEDFIATNPQAIEWGFYGRYLSRYLEHYDREKVLVLIYENMFEDIQSCKMQLADFLGLDVRLFTSELDDQRVNPRYLVKREGLFLKARDMYRYLRNRDIYWLPNMLKKLGVKRAFGRVQAPVMAMQPDTRERLRALYHDDTQLLREMMTLDLSKWYTAA